MISSEGLSEKNLHVNNCGRQTLSLYDTVTVRPKGRMDYHILYIMSGMCRAVVNGKEYEVHEGGFVLYRPFERQEYRFYKNDKSESLWIHFTGIGCERYLRELLLYDCPCGFVGKSAELISALTAMMSAKALGGTENDEVCDGYFYLVLALMSRARRYGREKLKRFSEVSEVAQYMSRNFENILPISEYAKMCHLSKSRFEHVFKANTGCTPLGYIYRMRIDAAMRLLENTDLRISQISEQVGFDDANYFTRVFGKYTGTTPKKYREIYIENNNERK